MNKKGVVCSRCETPVTFENVSEGYYAVCPWHEEDLYEFETHTTDRTEAWQEAIEYVLSVVEDMKQDKAYWDSRTLEELRQRIV